jgi:hypothetical protein
MLSSLIARPVCPRRRRWPWVLLFVSMALLLPLIGLVTFHLSEAQANRKEVAAAVARIEENDLHWRLEDFEEKRAVVPDEKNGAFRVLAADQQLPKLWPGDDLPDFWRTLPPEQRLLPESWARLTAELERQQPALKEAREIRNYRTGRYPITYTPNPLATLVPHFDSIRHVSFLLEADAVNRAEAKDFDAALVSCRAILATGQTLGDEGFLISVVLRCNCRAYSVRTLERIQAQGEASEDALSALRRQFGEEAQTRIVENGVRFERAQMHDVFESVESGRFSLKALKVMAPDSTPPTTWEKIESLWVTPRVLKGHAELLNAYTEAIKVARGPLEEQSYYDDAMYKIGGMSVNFFAGFLMPSMNKIMNSEVRSIAYLRCAVVAVSAELYRRRTGHWPNALADLNADFPNGLPADPYDGAPLRFKTLPDGIVIYSVGENHKDDGGVLYRPGPEKKPSDGFDIGFRLWDADKRRQPPPAPPAAKP